MSTSKLKQSRTTGAVPLDQPRLVFLVGPPRSGTTWLQKMLGCHPDIGTAQESHLFNHFLGGMIDSWDHLLQFKDGRGGIGLPAYQTEESFMKMLNSQVHEVLSGSDDYRKGTVFLEKTPDHIRHISDIQRVIPDAKIILMLRRPTDVIESMLNAGAGWGKNWAPGSTIQAIRLFRYFSKKAEHDLNDVNLDSICVVEYESLKNNTETVLSSVLDFIEVNSERAIVNSIINGNLTLKKHGEFARQTGNIVEEPEGFARTSKGKLNWMQRILIHVTLGSKALSTDTENIQHANGV